MESRLQEKYREASIESDLLDFLTLLSQTSFCYALVGGTACGGYFGHLPRRHIDIDILIHKDTSDMFAEYLRSQDFTERTNNRVVRMFFRDNTYFHIDVFTDYLYLANSPEWRVIAKYSLQTALEKRQRVTISSLDRSRSVEVFAVPREYLFIMKLFPPIEATNTHDLVFLTLFDDHHAETFAAVRTLIHGDVRFKEYLLARLKTYVSILTQNVWFVSLGHEQQRFVESSWRSLL